MGMQCPVCKEQLTLINPSQIGEYACLNDECPSNDSGMIHSEFYGVTQAEINKQG